MDYRRIRPAVSIVLLLGCAISLHGFSRLRMATFRSDVTPELGEPLIWTTAAAKVEDPLWAKGVLLEDGSARYVLCSVDWCGIGGSTDLLFRKKICAAAGTTVANVALHSVHQHTAPYIEGDGYRLLAALKFPPLMMSAAFLERVTDRLAQAVKEASFRLEPFDRIGAGQAPVEQVASARRIFRDGKLITRYSTGGGNPEIAALPEGAIDSVIRTVTLAAGARPLVRMHYYATHPQTFCCDGRISGDFVSAAREAVEKSDGVFQVYFTGCSGDVTVGKYNNGSVEARTALAKHLEQAMKISIAATRLEAAGKLQWRTVDLRLAPKASAEASPAALRSRLEVQQEGSGQDMYRAAIALAFAERQRPLPASSLRIGRVWILHLPGEPMLDFQKYAQQARPGEYLAVAGYGDISPGYLCTDRAFTEGGYEPSASNAGPGTEARVKTAIQKLLGR